MCVENQYHDLRSKYQYLFLNKHGNEFTITGSIAFEKNSIKDNYEIEIQIEANYPKSIPTVKEISSKIPDSFHKNPDKTLCLETRLTVYQIFRKEKTLVHFVDYLVVPYLYNYSYFLKYKKLPFGEHKHGAQGLLEDYKTRFRTTNNQGTLNLLKLLSTKSIYEGKKRCPCGNRKKFQNCHEDTLVNLLKSGYNFHQDYMDISCLLNKKPISTITNYNSNQKHGFYAVYKFPYASIIPSNSA